MAREGALFRSLGKKDPKGMTVRSKATGIEV